jgi:hypothetical protein
MDFFEVNVSLFKEVNIGEPNEYTLHVVTFCDSSIYYADGFEIDESQIAEGILGVEVVISENAETTPVTAPTPVVHTISLGALPFEEGTIEVASNKKKNPRRKVSTSGAMEIERPIGAGTVEELWASVFQTNLSS